MSGFTSGWQTGELVSKPPSTVISTESSSSADDVDIARMNEAEEERSVTEGLLVCDSSCSFEVETVDSEASSDAISNRENYTSEIGITDVAVALSGMTPTERADMELEDRDLSPMVLDHPKSAAVIHDVDMQDLPSVSASIAPANFYGMSKRAMGKQRAIPNQVVTRRDVHPVPMIDRSAEPKDDQYENDSLMSMPENEDMTYIFTFDSLGTERLPAIERLAKYLKQEAQDKLKRLDTGDAVGFKAQVPVQPNFYDCGLYLLHFAETFMSDPVKYARIIRTRGKGPVESRTRKGDWKYKQAVDMRDRFRAEIEKLSAEWRKDRAEKEEAKRREAAEGGPSIKISESSDDEINIVESTSTPASNKTKKRGKRKLLKKDTDVMRFR
ncbi:hypothetical protein C0993_005429 [Termitomyces sp. T159_Od127]|nr:hypothetical protein C0993_005429 [Termitomyces sp. T159_Od127]